jgi:hypothetical protein
METMTVEEYKRMIGVDAGDSVLLEMTSAEYLEYTQGGKGKKGVPRGKSSNGTRSALEDEALVIMLASGIPAPEIGVKLLVAEMGREWVCDFVWRKARVVLEIEGGAFAEKSRHRTGTGFTGDIYKYNALLLHRWLVLRATAEQVRNGDMVNWLRRGLLGDMGVVIPGTKGE